MRRWAWTAFLLVLVATGCGPAPPDPGTKAETPVDADRAQIEQVLAEYLPVLARAYATGEIEPLRQWAVERVLAQVEKRVVDLRDEGLVLDPTFRSLVVEDLTTWGNDFALVTTFEVWDLQYFSTGSRDIVSERLGHRSRVAYQLKVVDGRWLIFHRLLKQDLDDAETED